MSTPAMQPTPRQEALVVCPCSKMFRPKKPWQRFCSASCRQSWDVEAGTMGRVASVRKLTRGRVSVILRLEGSAADRALNLTPGDDIRVVKQP